MKQWLKIRKIYDKISYKFVLIILIVINISCKQGIHEVKLSDLPCKEIINDYGVPKRNLSFALTPLNIAGEHFAHGLGLHAPAKIHIDLDGQALSFSTKIGIDSAKFYYHSEEGWKNLIRVRKPKFPVDHVYDNRVNHDDVTQGGTAILRILLDGKEAYTSGLIKAGEQAIPVKLSLNGAKKMTIVVEPTDDGAYIDYVDLADATITFKKNMSPALYCHPEAILVNHVGFHPNAPKKCYMHGTKSSRFELVDALSGKVVHKGEMHYQPGHIGEYLRGDFSEFKVAGRYYLKSGDMKSVEFRIDDKVLDDCLQKHLFYVSQKRSGHPTKGWRPGFHFDDGVRDDNGKHQNGVGGWDDACDQNKNMTSNSSVLEGITTIGNNPSFEVNNADLADEIKWGNNFLHNMQEPDGYLMCIVRQAKWTDNIIGTPDDRVITTKPEGRAKHLNFVLSQLYVCRYFKETEHAYAKRSLEAGKKCLDWIMKKPDIDNPVSMSLAVLVYCELYGIKPDPHYQNEAARWVNSLMDVIHIDKVENLCYILRKNNDEFNNFDNNRVNMALNHFAKTFPQNKLAPACKNSVEVLSNHFYKPFCSQNAFGIVPWRISSDSMPTGKKLGNLYYCNALHVGINSNLAMKGNELVEAFYSINDTAFIELAQQQLDWIYGANPFNASTVYGLGYNQPILFQAHIPYFYPPRTPVIEGGAVCGICSDEYDNLAMYPGWWNSCEYWGPLNGALIRLENSLNSIYKKNR